MITFTQKISFLRRAFGSCDLDRKKQNAIFTCPSCGKGTGKKKFYVNLDTWQCHCWSCGIKGKTVLPVLKKYGTRDEVELLLKYLGKSDRDVVENSLLEKDNERISLPDGFILLADNQNSIDPDIRSCIKYLKSRGIGEKDLWRYRLGAVTSGRFKRRVIIPSFDMSGELNFFVTRSVDSDVRRKYINSKNNKKLIVFNEIDIDWSKELVIVEGPFDMINVKGNSTCLLGSSLREDYLLFSRIAANLTPVLLALDADMKKKEQEIAKLINSYGCQVRIMELGKFSDVGEMSKDDFLKLSSQSKHWDPSSRLKMKIGSIRSGSLI